MDDGEYYIYGPLCVCGHELAKVNNGIELVIYCTNPACCYSETKYRADTVLDADNTDDDPKFMYGDEPNDAE